jgi:hypothetical protein
LLGRLPKFKKEVASVEHQTNPRREFLANVGKTTVLAAAGTTMLASQSLGAEKSSATVVKGRSKKVEVLYQKTRHWEDFYKNAY